MKKNLTRAAISVAQSSEEVSHVSRDLNGRLSVLVCLETTQGPSKSTHIDLGPSQAPIALP